MTKQEIEDAITDLLEVRKAITDVNSAAGQTIFNPAATGALVAVIERLREEAAAQGRDADDRPDPQL